ncbi:ABC transporter permease [Clostridium collagenovorans]|nr:ABC transporter permease [Clostridium collagenovorans]
MSNKNIRKIRSIITIIIIILFWEYASQTELVRKSILPAPSTIVKTFFTMISSGELMGHIGISILRVLEGFLIGAILAIIVGILCGLYKKVEDYLSLLIGFLRPIPVLAWTPLLILWLGIDEASKVALIAIGTFWTVLLNVVSGIKGTDKKLMEVTSMLEKDKRTLLLKVILPSALPSIFTGLRSGIDMAWRSVVGAEMIAASKGIGFLITYAREISQPDVMIVGMICIGIIGILIEKLLAFCERHLLKWNISIIEN